MQTFLPYPDIVLSAQVLDRQRLGKQRVECLQILNAILDPTRGWANHPATRMWRSSPGTLSLYMQACIDEWKVRGYKNTLVVPNIPQDNPPFWLGDPVFHASHRSNLLRKDPEHYGRFGWAEPPDLPYIWP